MPLHLYTFQNPEAALAPFAEGLKSNPDVLVPNFIVTGHAETNDWITRSLVRQIGIVSNLKFLKPDDISRMLYRLMDTSGVPMQMLTRNFLVWKIHQALHTLNDTAVNDYGKRSPLHSISLAVQYADVFQRYQEEYPEIIREWNAGNDTIGGEQGTFQFKLWQMVRSGAENFLDQTQLYDVLQTQLWHEVNQDLIRNRIGALHCFGPVWAGRDFRALLQSLSDLIPVNVYEYASGFAAMQETDPGSSAWDTRISPLSFADPVIQVQPLTLPNPVEIKGQLQAIQTVLSGGVVPDSFDFDSAATNISINNHYTIDREVEELSQFLIRQFNENPELKPADVVVFCADTDAYSSALEKHFNKADSVIPFIYFDKSYHFQDSPFEALSALFQLEESTFTATELLRLLNFSVIREKFGITENQMLLRRMVRLANIRRSFEGNPAEETHFSSWLYGFHRLFVGSLLPPGISGTVQIEDTEFLPIDVFEGKEAEQIPLLYRFVCTVHHWLQKRQATRDLRGWMDFLYDSTLHELMEVPDHHLMALNRMTADWSDAVHPEGVKMEAETFTWFFQQVLAGMTYGEKSGKGGVRIMKPSPNWIVPVPVVAFLGLSQEAFPRIQAPFSADLNPYTHANSLRAKDEQAFYQALFAAGSTLYLSYVGRNVHNNNLLPHTPLLHKVWNQLDGLNVPALSKMIQHHRMNNFVVQHKAKENSLFFPEAPATIQNSDLPFPEAGAEWERDEDNRLIVPLKKLETFLIDSAEYFYNHVLKVYFDKEEEGLKDKEEMQLDNSLDKWSIFNEILNDRFGDTRLSADHLKMRGKLPLRNIGAYLFNEQVEAVGKLIVSMGLPPDATCIEKNIPVDIQFSSFRIVGTIDTRYCALNNTYYLIFPTNTLMSNSKKRKPKYAIQVALRSALLFIYWAAQHPDSTPHLIMVSKDEIADLRPYPGPDFEPKLVLFIGHLLAGSRLIYPLNSDVLKENWDYTNPEAIQLAAEKVRIFSEYMIESLQRLDFVVPPPNLPELRQQIKEFAEL